MVDDLMNYCKDHNYDVLNSDLAILADDLIEFFRFVSTTEIKKAELELKQECKSITNRYFASRTRMEGEDFQY